MNIKQPPGGRTKTDPNEHTSKSPTLPLLCQNSYNSLPSNSLIVLSFPICSNKNLIKTTSTFHFWWFFGFFCTKNNPGTPKLVFVLEDPTAPTERRAGVFSPDALPALFRPRKPPADRLDTSGLGGRFGAEGASASHAIEQRTLKAVWADWLRGWLGLGLLVRWLVWWLLRLGQLLGLRW